jgi:hypothetical protein
MNIRSNLLAIVAVAGMVGFGTAASAEPAKNTCKPESTAITSSTIVYAGWYVSGTCLEMVTNATLANDDGAGFQELSFTYVKNPDNPAARVSLLIPSVSRAGPGEVGIPLGQYLLQLKSCPNGKASEKCRILDEKYLIVPMGAAFPS